MQGKRTTLEWVAGIGRNWMLAGALLAVASATGGYFAFRSQQDPFGGGLMCHSGKCCKVCPADFPKGNLIGNRPVLNPLMFVGTARQAYIVAQQNPWLLAHLWCYCGCDRTNGHRCLLDCYRDYHGATCAICANEALEANQLFNQGSPVEQIREALRARFSRHE
jgi:Protein of unknown function with PCYCGC motif